MIIERKIFDDDTVSNLQMIDSNENDTRSTQNLNIYIEHCIF